MKLSKRRKWIPAGYISSGLLLATVMVTGCGAPDADFRANEAYLTLQENKVGELGTRRESIKQNIEDVLTGLYGTPDEPHLLSVDGLSDVVEIENLQIAAGPTGSIDEAGARRGLYREHCAHCHGITGDGRGPTAEFLNPYPRDYRLGVYKFKSTTGKMPPTRDDLMKTLVEGIPGTAMPSFRLLNGFELDALVDYVRYLSIRGETERALIDYAVELEDDQNVLWNIADEAQQTEAKEAVEEMVADVVAKYVAAHDNRIPVPAPPENWETAESIARGRELFAGPIANCIKCHGLTALGDGVVNDYDDWTKEFFDPNAPGGRETFAELYGSTHAVMKPRPIRPRNLRMNVFRGGRRPVDLYWRLANGIVGTPMPAVPIKAEDAPEEDPRLVSDDVWHIIAYVRNLPYEDISEPAPLPKYQRERH
jgi:mono/diheme cytochrome c family protein